MSLITQKIVQLPITERLEEMECPISFDTMKDLLFDKNDKNKDVVIAAVFKKNIDKIEELDQLTLYNKESFSKISLETYDNKFIDPFTREPYKKNNLSL